MRSDPNGSTIEDKQDLNQTGVSGIELTTGASHSDSQPTASLSHITPQSSAPHNQASQPVNEDISPEGLLKVISVEWTNEMERIRSLGLNGYKRRKESRSECLVQSGHAEIEGDNKLFIYGNALEVLNNPDF